MFEVTMRGSVAVMNLYGPIGRLYGGIEANEVISALSGVKASRLEYHLNTEGGSYKDGVAMFNRIRAFEGPTHAIVDGAAWSAGSLLMLAAGEREMSPGSRVMIHNAQLQVVGDHRDLMAAATETESLSADAAKLYASRTNLSAEDARAMMDRETWFNPEEAHNAGFTTIETSEAEFCAREYDAQMVGRLRAIPEDVRKNLEQFKQRRSTEAVAGKLDAFVAKWMGGTDPLTLDGE